MKLTGRTVVDVCLTVVSAISKWTFTRVAATVVYAKATIFTRTLSAFIHILSAALTYSLQPKVKYDHRTKS